MKKRRLFSTLAAALVTASMLAALPMNAGAAGTNYETTLVSDSINKTVLKKNLVIENDANIPATNFNFTASAGEPKKATATTLAVLAGINPNKIKFGSETTADGNGTIEYAAQTKSANPSDNVTITDSYPDNDHYTATKSTNLDFSECGFTEPGVYRYIITETGTNAGITNDNTDTRTIDVYVEDATDTTSGTTTKQLKIAGYVMYVGTQTAGPSNASTETTGTNFTAEDGTTTKTPNGMEVAGATKSVGFKNTYATHDLTFGKEVTGNQGSKDKYFKFTVNITGAVAGTIYDVDVSKANATLPAANTLNAATDSSYAGQTNPTSITVGTDGTISTDFYLQDGQYITIKGLADKTKYEITEVAEDYTSTTGITADNSTFKEKDTDTNYKAMEGAVSNTSEGIQSDIFTGYTNNRNGVIPTGILISVAPAAIVGICVIGGIVFLIAKNKRRESEED